MFWLLIIILTFRQSIQQSDAFSRPTKRSQPQCQDHEPVHDELRGLQVGNMRHNLTRYESLKVYTIRVYHVVTIVALKILDSLIHS